jgi:F-type H+-transporting ATPase subunit delta
MPVLTTGPEKRYATALFDLAQSHGNVEIMAHTGAAMAEVCQGFPALRTFLSSPLVANQEKIRTMLDVAQVLKAPPLFENFLRLVGQEQRLNLLEGMLFHFQIQVDAAAGRVTAHVSAATPLTKEQKKELENIARKLAPAAREIVLDEKTIPALLAGVRLQIGSRAWDSTLRARLNQLKQHLSH